MSCSHVVKAVSAAAALVAACASAADPADLVTVTVKGTSIERLPTYVEVIVDDPKEEAAGLIKPGGGSAEIREHGRTAVTVTRNTVPHYFFEPEDYNVAIKGHRFRVGDVVYGFTLRSPDEVAEFATRHDLKLAGRIALQDAPFLLYRASPGYYVICLVPVPRHICPMHPKITGKAEERCPICAMPLVRIEAPEPFIEPEDAPPAQR